MSSLYVYAYNIKFDKGRWVATLWERAVYRLFIHSNCNMSTCNLSSKVPFIFYVRSFGISTD